MTTIEVMERLDALVADQAPDSRYAVAKALYEASLAGLLAVTIPPTVLYAWVVKWATIEDLALRRYHGGRARLAVPVVRRLDGARVRDDRPPLG